MRVPSGDHEGASGTESLAGPSVEVSFVVVPLARSRISSQARPDSAWPYTSRLPVGSNAGSHSEQWQPSGVTFRNPAPSMPPTYTDEGSAQSSKATSLPSAETSADSLPFAGVPGRSSRIAAPDMSLGSARNRRWTSAPTSVSDPSGAFP